MFIRQEENSPIGDYFHDSGLYTVFNALSESIDDFELDSDKANAMIDDLMANLKGLKNIIKKCEAEETKKLQQQFIKDMKNRGAE